MSISKRLILTLSGLCFISGLLIVGLGIGYGSFGLLLGLPALLWISDWAVSISEKRTRVIFLTSLVSMVAGIVVVGIWNPSRIFATLVMFIGLPAMWIFGLWLIAQTKAYKEAFTCSTDKN